MNRNRIVLCVSFVAVVAYMLMVYWLSDIPSITMDIQTSIANLLKRDVFEHCLEFIPLGLLTARAHMYTLSHTHARNESKNQFFYLEKESLYSTDSPLESRGLEVGYCSFSSRARLTKSDRF